MLRFDKTTYLALLLKSILPIKLSNSLRESDTSLFLESMNIVSIPLCNYFEFIIFLYTFLVI